MFRRLAVVALIAFAITVPAALRATAIPGPGACPSDSKLLNGGPTAVFGDGPGTWWGLVTNGLTAAGLLTEADQVDYLNWVFGTSYSDIDDLKIFNLQLVDQFWDINRNGYVCAFELRGTRKHFGDPLINLTSFGIADDRE